MSNQYTKLFKVLDTDVDLLCGLFPQLERSEASLILHEKGCLERAADSVLVNVEVINNGEEPEEPRFIPSYIRCPKCFSPDVLEAGEKGLLVCGKCLYHFPLSQAKKGASRGLNTGPSSKKKKKKAISIQPKQTEATCSSDVDNQSSIKKSPKTPIDDVAEATTPTTPLTSPDSPSTDCTANGPVHQKLMDNREKKRHLIRICVSHAGSPKDKRVISVPRDQAFESLMKQARAKFRLKRPLKGARLLPSSTPLSPDDLAKVADGSEVLVTHHCEGDYEVKAKGNKYAKKGSREPSQQQASSSGLDEEEKSSESKCIHHGSKKNSKNVGFPVDDLQLEENRSLGACQPISPTAANNFVESPVVVVQ